MNFFYESDKINNIWHSVLLHTGCFAYHWNSSKNAIWLAMTTTAKVHMMPVFEVHMACQCLILEQPKGEMQIFIMKMTSLSCISWNVYLSELWTIHTGCLKSTTIRFASCLPNTSSLSGDNHNNGSLEHCDVIWQMRQDP